MEKINYFLSDNNISLDEFIKISFPCVEFILKKTQSENNTKESIQEIIQESIRQNIEKNINLSNILSSQLKIQEQVSEINQDFLKNKILKGKKTEKKYFVLLSENLKGFEIIDISNLGHNCDLKIKNNGKPDILLEIKEYTSVIPTIQVSKFKSDITKCSNHGIFISNNSNIALKNDWDFEILGFKRC